MFTVTPAQTTTVSEAGLPSGVPVGFSVQNAATGIVAIAHTAVGVIERPAGSGNYVINFVAPVEGDLYLLIVNWNDGVITPETTRVSEFRVSTEVELGSSGLGAIADYVKMYLGGETWKGLADSSDYGEAFVGRAIHLVKHRVMTNVPDVAGEANLHPLVLDYLALCAAIELAPAARDYWASQIISVSTGNDSTEISTYANRASLMNDLRDDLLRKLAGARALALPFIDAPLLQANANGPSIDEVDDYRSTADPRDFPAHGDFPGFGGLVTDAFGIPKATGVRL